MKAILLTIKIALLIIQGKSNDIISVIKTLDIKKEVSVSIMARWEFGI